MNRTSPLRALIIIAALVPFAALAVLADPYSDLVKVHAAFQAAKSWHAEEHFSNGKTTTVDFVAPDRWRMQPTPDVTELIIGDDVYMVRNGKSTHLPFGGGMIRKTVEQFGSAPVSDEVKQSARDLGAQTLNGQSVHVYSFTSHGMPVTMYVGANSLPVQQVTTDKKGMTTIVYSKYNEPITIEP